MIWAICLALFLAPLSALAAPPADTQTMTYTLYAGGITVGTGKLILTSDNSGHYYAQVDGDDSGALKEFVPWDGHFESQGLRPQTGTTIPQSYTSETDGRGGREVKRFTWSHDGAFIAFTDTKKGKDVTPKYSNDLAANTVDPLSVMLAMLDTTANGKDCGGNRDLFDGLRRFRLTMHPQPTETLAASKYNVFSGPAAACTLEITPEAGKWPRKPRGWLLIQEQGRQRGSLPTVWAAHLDKDGPAVPVRIRALTNYGTMYVQLTHYQHG